MMTIEIRNGVTVGLDELIQSVSRLSLVEREAVLSRLNQLVLRQTEAILPLPDDAIVQKVKELVPASVMRRFKQLQTKQHKGTITEKEQSEICLITDFIEEKSAERVKLLSGVAKMRNVTVVELIRELGIKEQYA